MAWVYIKLTYSVVCVTIIIIINIRELARKATLTGIAAALNCCITILILLAFYIFLPLCLHFPFLMSFSYLYRENYFIFLSNRIRELI